MKSAIKWLKKPSISKRLIISFTLVLVLPIITLSTISYQIAKQELDMKSCTERMQESMS